MTATILVDGIPLGGDPDHLFGVRGPIRVTIDRHTTADQRAERFGMAAMTIDGVPRVLGTTFGPTPAAVAERLSRILEEARKALGRPA